MLRVIHALLLMSVITIVLSILESRGDDRIVQPDFGVGCSELQCDGKIINPDDLDAIWREGTIDSEAYLIRLASLSFTNNALNDSPILALLEVLGQSGMGAWVFLERTSLKLFSGRKNYTFIVDMLEGGRKQTRRNVEEQADWIIALISRLRATNEIRLSERLWGLFWAIANHPPIGRVFATDPPQYCGSKLWAEIISNEKTIYIYSGVKSNEQYLILYNSTNRVTEALFFRIEAQNLFKADCRCPIGVQGDSVMESLGKTGVGKGKNKE